MTDVGYVLGDALVILPAGRLLLYGAWLVSLAVAVWVTARVVRSRPVGAPRRRPRGQVAGRGRNDGRWAGRAPVYDDGEATS